MDFEDPVVATGEGEVECRIGREEWEGLGKERRTGRFRHVLGERPMMLGSAWHDFAAKANME